MVNIKDIAKTLTDEQKLVILAGDGEEVLAGIGTWQGLQDVGLLDRDFVTTPLGIAVAHELLSSKGSGDI